MNPENVQIGTELTVRPDLDSHFNYVHYNGQDNGAPSEMVAMAGNKVTVYRFSRTRQWKIKECVHDFSWTSDMFVETYTYKLNQLHLDGELDFNTLKIEINSLKK